MYWTGSVRAMKSSYETQTVKKKRRQQMDRKLTTYEINSKANVGSFIPHIGALVSAAALG